MARANRGFIAMYVHCEDPVPNHAGTSSRGEVHVEFMYGASRRFPKQVPSDYDSVTNRHLGFDIKARRMSLSRVIPVPDYVNHRLLEESVPPATGGLPYRYLGRVTLTAVRHYPGTGTFGLMSHPVEPHEAIGDTPEGVRGLGAALQEAMYEHLISLKLFSTLQTSGVENAPRYAEVTTPVEKGGLGLATKTPHPISLWLERTRNRIAVRREKWKEQNRAG